MTVEPDRVTVEPTPEKTQVKSIRDAPIIHLISDSSWKSRPWSINLLGLLQDFLDRIILVKQVNLGLAGRAVSVASLLHRKRAEYLLQEEKKRALKKNRKARKLSKKNIDELMLPTTPRLMRRRVSLIELLNALTHAIQIIKRRSTKSTNGRQLHSEITEETLLTLLPEELVRELDLGSENIEQFITKVYETILRQDEIANGDFIGFISLVQKLLADEKGILTLAYKEIRERLIRLYIVRVLLCVLYLLLRNKIIVNQTEFFSDLQIRPLVLYTSEEL